MKIRFLIPLLSMLLVSSLAIPIAGTFTGCAAVQEGHDPIVVNAERTAQAAFELMDAFTQMEHNNRESLRKVSPEIEKAANTVRVEGRKAIEELRNATRVYKNNRSAENKAGVDTYIVLVNELKNIAVRHLTSAKTVQ